MRKRLPASPMLRLSLQRLLASAIFLTCAGSAQTAFAQSAFDYAGRWTFDDCRTTSSVLRDTSGNNAAATRGSSVFCETDSDGRASGAVNLVVSQPGNGTAATTVSVSNTAVFPLTNAMAVSAKIKLGATAAGAILTKGWNSSTGVAQKTFQLAIVKDASGVSRLNFTLWVSAPGSSLSLPLSLQSPAGIALSVWTQVGASYDAEKGMQLFVNGQSVATSGALNVVIKDAPAGSPSAMWMGGGAPQQTVGYTGLIDDVWVSKGSCTNLEAGRAVVVPRELMITKPGVVDDPVRTTGMGVWTFGHLMSQMVPANPSNPQAALDKASDMVMAMFESFDSDQVINTQTIAKRQGIKAMVLDNWPRTSSGKLDLSRAPLRLLAIVNRMDLLDLSRGDAGEGRFVFGVLNANGTTAQFTLILEYRLPAQTSADTRIWARDWHALGIKVEGTPEYNAALQVITDRFTTRGASPKRLNGSAISQVRTNERVFTTVPWELREFSLGVASGETRLLPSTVAMTPGELFKTMTSFVGAFINENAAGIKDGTYTVPLAPKIAGTQLTYFRGGSALVSDQDAPWDGPNIVVPTEELRHKFALNTCNGCHFTHETGTPFLHISPRAAGAAAHLSDFLTGDYKKDFTSPAVFDRKFNDLNRRMVFMTDHLLKCPAPTATATTFSTTTARTSTISATTATSTTTTTTAPSLTKGISRVH